MNRREALRLLTAAAVTGVVPRIGRAADDDLYDVGRFGNVRVLHLTDTHAQLLPVFFREPSVNIGIGSMRGKPPHLVGRAFLEHFGIEAGGRAAHAFTFLDFEEAAHRYRPHGRVRAPQDADRPVARRRRRRQLGPARWRRHVAGKRACQCAAGRGHGRGRQSSRHRSDDRPLGVHLRRAEAAAQSRAVSRASSSPRTSS